MSLESEMVDEGWAMETEVTDKRMSFESEIGDECWVMDAE